MDTFEMNAFDAENLELVDSGEEFMELSSEQEQELEQEVEPGLKPDESQKDQEDPIDSEEVVGEGDQDEGDTESDETEDSDSSSDNLYSSFASVLADEGVLPSLDLNEVKIETIEDISKAIKNEIEVHTKDYLINKLGEDGYDALEKGISLRDYQSYMENTNSLEGINEEVLSEDLELAKRIIIQDYLNQGIPEDRVNRMVSRIVDIGEEALLEDSLESLESLKEFEKVKLARIAEEEAERNKQFQRQQEKIDNDVKNMIYKSSEIIEGMGSPSKTFRQRVYDNMTKIVSRSPEGALENNLMKHRRENPIDFDVKLYYLYELTKGFSDFSGMIQKSKSSALSKFEKELRQSKTSGSSSPAYMEDSESYFGIGDELV